MSNYIECFLDSARGQYIPRDFAEMIDVAQWRGIDESDLETLKNGPYNEFYSEAWDSVLDNAETRKDSLKLYMGENGDLFLINPDALKSEFDEIVRNTVEYETTHKDSGNNYAHMVCEGMGANLDQSRLKKWCVENDIETHGLDSDELMDLALDVFEMESRHMFSSVKDTEFQIDSYPVGEIEIQIPDEMDHPFLESDESYISDNGFAYVTTDSVWCAIVTIDAMREAINATMEGKQ